MKYLVLLFLLGGGWGLSAQVPAGRAVEYRKVSEENWKKAGAELDYSQDLPELPPAPKPTPSGTNWPNSNWDVNAKFWGHLFQILAVVLALVGVGFGIYRMMQEPRNRQIARDGAEITVDNLDAYLPETDLERFLRDALAQQNYTLAVRLYFLQIIKDLSNKGQLHWSIEKTNRDYLREMRGQSLEPAFRQATRQFERIWYGNVPLTASGFAQLEPEFKRLLQAI
ncbi:MAG: DUF4129 domain-containing protein [Saprospiraceae bacterium]|nr:DUF4129 domain-containing protein [Saprospiraceae bacterium]